MDRNDFEAAHLAPIPAFVAEGLGRVTARAALHAESPDESGETVFPCVVVLLPDMVNPYESAVNAIVNDQVENGLSDGIHIDKLARQVLGPERVPLEVFKVFKEAVAADGRLKVNAQNNCFVDTRARVRSYSLEGRVTDPRALQKLISRRTIFGVEQISWDEIVVTVNRMGVRLSPDNANHLYRAFTRDPRFSLVDEVRGLFSVEQLRIMRPYDEPGSSTRKPKAAPYEPDDPLPQPYLDRGGGLDNVTTDKNGEVVRQVDSFDDMMRGFRSVSSGKLETDSPFRGRRRGGPKGKRKR